MADGIIIPCNVLSPRKLTPSAVQTVSLAGGQRGKPVLLVERVL